MQTARRTKRYNGKRARLAFFAVALAALAGVLLAPRVAAAQSVPRGLLEPGNAAVAGFSGVIAPAQIAPGIDPASLTFIDRDGPSLRIVDLQNMAGPPAAQLVDAPKPFTITAGQIGQVFAVALDNVTPPNIYVAATSSYGLPVVVAGADGQLSHSKAGGPNKAFMPGLWGNAAANGGPGSIWRIDGITGAVTLFANVALNGAINSGPALGGLAFDPDTNALFVADRETGMIHRFEMDGRETARFDHGTQGREAAGLPPVAFDPSKRLDITNPLFDSEQPQTWEFAPGGFFTRSPMDCRFGRSPSRPAVSPIPCLNSACRQRPVRPRFQRSSSTIRAAWFSLNGPIRPARTIFMHWRAKASAASCASPSSNPILVRHVCGSKFPTNTHWVSRSICATAMAAWASDMITTGSDASSAEHAADSCGRPARTCAVRLTNHFRHNSMRRVRPTSMVFRAIISGISGRKTRRR
jgi:hypothetical protein